MSVTICGKEFLISALFSMNDMELYLKALEHGDSAKSVLANVIYRKLQKCTPPIPTLDEICTETEKSFEPYVMAIINSDHHLKSFFDKTDALNSLSERFATANKQYWKESIKEMTESVKSLWGNNIQQLHNQFVQQTTQIMDPIKDMISQFSNMISDVIASIKIPSFTEERKQELEANYKEWGKLGWSSIPHAPLYLFNDVPTDEREADKIILQYFNKKDIEGLFAEMQAQFIKKEDLKSAIYCFENKQYKACALLLFGIIDAKLI